jgi:hypothetical protein
MKGYWFRIIAAYLLLQVAGRLMKESEQLVSTTVDAKPTLTVVKDDAA